MRFFFPSWTVAGGAGKTNLAAAVIITSPLERANRIRGPQHRGRRWGGGWEESKKKIGGEKRSQAPPPRPGPWFHLGVWEESRANWREIRGQAPPPVLGFTLGRSLRRKLAGKQGPSPAQCPWGPPCTRASSPGSKCQSEDLAPSSG